MSLPWGPHCVGFKDKALDAGAATLALVDVGSDAIVTKQYWDNAHAIIITIISSSSSSSSSMFMIIIIMNVVIVVTAAIIVVSIMMIVIICMKL